MNRYSLGRVGAKEPISKWIQAYRTISSHASLPAAFFSRALRDVLKKRCPDALCEEVKIKGIMSKPLITVDADTLIGVAVESIVAKKVRKLVVTEGKKVIGIVSQKDLMKGTLDAFRAMQSAFSMP